MFAGNYPVKNRFANHHRLLDLLVPKSLLALLTTLVVCQAGNAAEDASQVNADGNRPAPNIVHILVDDLGWQDVACYYRDNHTDAPVYETPMTDSIASRGVRFLQAYAPSPTCSPSRAAYLSGHYGPKNGVYHVKGNRMPRSRGSFAEINPYYSARLPITKTIIPSVLKKAGYITAHVGKWHVCGENQIPNPLQLGFDFSYGADKQYNDPEVVDPKDEKLNNLEGIFNQPRNNRLTDFNNPLFLPLVDDERPYDSLTDVSVRWIDKVGRGQKPFFLNFCTKLVHGPIMTRDQKRLRHYCDKLGIPFPKDPGSICDPDGPGHNNPYYASMVDSVDWMIGEVIEKLEGIDDPRNPGHKLIDNTYVVISSDNGGAQKLATWASLDGKKRHEKVTDNSPLREGKSWAYEGGLRIPLIVIGPGIKAGSVNKTTPVHLLDLFPTFMAMAGLDSDKSLSLDGCNILPLIKGESAVAKFDNGKDRESLFFHHPADDKSFSAIRKGPWKLMKNTGSYRTDAPELQLFRLYDDNGAEGELGEKQNLAQQYPEVVKSLHAELKQWMAKNDARSPYLSPATPGGKLPGQKLVAKVSKSGANGDKIWVEFETKSKSKVTEAFLMYTLNGGTELKDHAPRLEEWIKKKDVKLTNGRVEATAPPGMTHAVFCLVDENNFLIHSESVPEIGRECSIDGAVSTFLKNGFAYRPGLESLIKLGQRVHNELEEKEQPTKSLDTSIRQAQNTLKSPVTEESYANAIRQLRREILKVEKLSHQSRHPDLHFLSTSKNW